MYFFNKCALGLLTLQASCFFASPTVESQVEHDIIANLSGHQLGKRYPIQLNFDNSVSAGDRAIINQGFQDMQALATAAANYDYSNTAGSIDGIYRRYFPNGYEDKVKALFRYLAGIAQTWGNQQLTTPDFGGITIKRSNQMSFNQASTTLTRGQTYDITINRLGFPPVISPSIEALRFRGTKTSIKMEMLGSVILHELL